MSAITRDAPLQQQRGVREAQTTGQRLRGQYTSAGPLGMILDRLERVRRCGKGYIACCPAHADRSASLSLAEGNDGRTLVHCFAGCSALDVVQSVGLQLADLYPERLSPLDPDHRRELRQYAREANWKAALNVLGMEAGVVLCAARQVARWQPLSPDDDARLALALSRIDSARGVLNGRS